jgi:hypothetical protein
LPRAPTATRACSRGATTTPRAACTTTAPATSTRFTSRDPLGIWADLLNLGNGYTYAGNNPWSRRDPFGLESGGNKTTWWQDFWAAYNDDGLWEGYFDTFGGGFAKGVMDSFFGLAGAAKEWSEDPVFGSLNAALDLYDLFRRDREKFGDDAINLALLAYATLMDGLFSGDGETYGQLAGDVLLGGAILKALKYLRGAGSIDSISGELLDDLDTSIRGQGWKAGGPIDNLTSKGNVPSWDAVRERFWKNEAKYNGDNYSAENLQRMRSGSAPQRLNPVTGLMESMELHHFPPQRVGGVFEFRLVWPEDHAAIDPFRHTGNQ